MSKVKRSQRAIVLVLAFLTALMLVITTSAWSAFAATPPASSKKLTDNGDGTYTLSLSVTGKTAESSSTEVHKANVVLVLDTSSSMYYDAGSAPYTYYTVPGTPAGPSGGGVSPTYYRNDNGTPRQLYWRNNAWRQTDNNNGTIFTGQFYSRSRLWAEKHALTDDEGIIDSLLEQNVPGDANKSDIIEIAITDFNSVAHYSSGSGVNGFSTNATTLKNTINGLGTGAGTNWEDALVHADALADAIKAAQPGEDVYVIFLTDGQPTRRVGSTANENSNTCWNSASDNARSIVTDGYKFYSLFTWGDSTYAHYLSSLVQYAYTGQGNYNTALSPQYQQYYSNAESTDALIAALKQIVHDITESVGYTNVELDDGVTSYTSTNVSASTEGGAATGFKYYRSGGAYGTAQPYGQEWTGAPDATVDNNGNVNWDLDDLILEDGVTYTVTFVVWPSQEAQDLVADLNNGIKDPSTLTDEERAQIIETGGVYTLKTNTDFPKVTYSTVTTTTVDGVPTQVVSDPETSNITNPSPVGLAGADLNAVKSWEDSLDPSQREEIEDVVLYLKRDGQYYYVDENNQPLGVTLNEATNWTRTDYINIAPGLFVAEGSPAYPTDLTGYTTVQWEGTTYVLLEKGHEYVFEESDINNHFELTAYTHHPMILGENADRTPHVVDVVFTKDASGKITGIESITELGDNLSATNSIKGGINISKKVVDESGAEIDNTDPFTVTVTVCDREGNALPTKTASDGTQYTIDYRIYYGPNNPNYDEASGGGRSDHIYKSGTSFEETLYVGDVIRVVNVESEAVYMVEETAPKGYELVDITYTTKYGADGQEKANTPVQIGGKNYYPVNLNSAANSIVTNKYTFGDLEISKTVEVPDDYSEEAANAIKDTEFEFTVDLYTDANKTTSLPEGFKYNYYIINAGGTQAEEPDGTISSGGKITLKHGQTVKIEKLPEGAYYEVTETAAPGFTTTKTGDTGTIVKNETQTAAFTNTYEPTPATASFPVKKNLVVPTGLTGPATWEYTIDVAADDEESPVADTMTGTVSNTTDTVTFGDFTFTAPGTYTYTVSETGTISGVANDAEASGKTVTITVVDDGEGRLTATVSGADATAENPSTNTTFTNTYSATPAEVSIPVEKVMELNGLTGPASWTYTITAAAQGSAPVATDMTATVTKAASTGSIGPIQYTAPGTYLYTLTEDGTVDGVTNDTIPQKFVTVTVTDNGSGALVATVTSTGYIPDGTASLTGPQTTTFTNEYNASGEGSFPVKKVLQVPEGMSGPDSWTYTINVAANGGAPEAATMTGTVTKANDTVTFGAFKFTNKVGTYTYTVTETGTVAGVTNDDAETTGKTVTFTVSDNGDGTLKVEADSTTESPLTFTNKYDAEPVTASFPVQKILEVPEGSEGPTTWQYTINVAANGGAPTAATMTGTVSNTGDTVTFGDFTYEKPGTYTYTVTEEGTIPGVSNDSAAATGKTVTVTVVDNKDGTMTATADYTADSPLTFTNKYQQGEATATIKVNKNLVVPEGLDGPAEWSYDVAVAGNNGAPTGETMSGTVDQDNPSFTTSEITYTKPGTYTYTVTETGTYLGVTNDTETSKTVTVEVVDNHDGTLTATVTGADSTEEQASSETTFTNTYSAEPVTQAPEATKVLEGNRTPGLQDGEFEFTATITPTENVTPTSLTATNDAQGKVDFGEGFKFTKKGTYTVTVKETIPDPKAPFMTYDEHEYTYTITVTDDGEGNLVATKSDEPGGNVFTNKYKPDDDGKTVASAKNPTTEINGQLVGVGDELVYTIKWVNDAVDENGKSAKAEITVTDKVPTGTEFVTATNGGTESGGTVTWTLGEQEAGATGTVTMTVKVTDEALDTSIENDATIQVGDNDPKTTNKTTNYVPEKKVTTAENTTDANGDNVLVGQDLTYTISYQNPYDEPATIVITDDLSTGLKYKSSTPEATVSGQTVTWTLENVPAGEKGTVSVTATVTEDAVTEGEIPNTAKVKVGDDPEVETNKVVNPVPQPVELKATKEVRGANATEAFEFKLTLKEGDAANVKVGGEDFAPITKSTAADIAKGATETVSFGEMTFMAEGTYVFTVDETTTTDVDGWTYDASTHDITVTVTKDNEGKLVAEIAQGENNPKFENIYREIPIGDGTKIPVPVTKDMELNGLTGPDDWTYTFTLEAVTEGAPMPEDPTVTISKGGDLTKSFGQMIFKKAGTYEYKVTEAGDYPGVQNDAAAESGKTITVVVTEEGDDLVAVVQGADGDGDATTFENIYNVNPVTGNIPVKKIVEVPEGLEGPEDWSFTITAEPAEGSPAAETPSVTVTKDNPEGTIGDMTFTAPGTYTYTLTEEGDVAGVTNDPDAKTVIFTVTDKGDGTMSVSMVTSSPDGSVTADDPAIGETTPQKTLFTNTYDVEKTTASFPVKKILTVPEGLEGPDEWSFDIAVAAQDGAPEAEAMTGTVTNEEDTVTFGEFEYTRPGTYTYKVTESGSVAGVTMDDKAEEGKIVTVKVVENKDGTLTATVTGADSTEEKPSSETTFTNTYSVTPATQVPEALKVLEGNRNPGLQKDEFEFTATITPTDNVTPTTLTAKNDADGKVDFGDGFAFTAPGEYSVTIKETIPDPKAPFMTYDEHEYTYTIVVTDGKDGKLVAEVKDEEGGNTFTNKYKPDDDGKTVGTVDDPKTSIDGKLVGVGDEITYTIKWVNDAVDESGKSAKAEITVTDVVPTGTEFVTASNGGTESGGTVTWNLGEQAAGATGEVTMTVKILEEAADTSIENEATIKVGDNDPKTTNKTTNYVPEKTVTTATNTEDANGDNVVVGDDVTYTIKYKNPYDEAATVVVTDVLSTGLEYKSSTPEAEVDGQKVTWTLTDVAAGAEGTVSVTATVTDAAVSEGEIPNTGTVKVNDDPEVKTNKVSNPVPEPIELKATKLVKGADAVEAFEFALNLTKGEAANVKVDGKDFAPITKSTSDGIKNNTTETVNFGKFSFKAEGDYVFTVDETTEASEDGWVYDEETYDIIVRVEKNEEGKLVASILEESNNPTFVNIYRDIPVGGDTKTPVPVTKVMELNGLKGPAEWSFDFTIEAVTENAPLPNDKTVTIKSTDSSTTAKFGEMLFKKPGTYEYTITESGDVAGVTNDPELTKNIQIVIEEDPADKSKLIATVVGADGDGAASTTFRNEYNVEPGTGEFPVKKIMEIPEGLEGPEEWSYDITVTPDGEAPSAETMSGTVTNENDTITFSGFTFEEPGTYTYTVSESGEIAGVSMDSEAAGKKVVFDVSDNQQGGLDVDVSYNSENPLTFTNKYATDTVDANVSVTKVLVVPEGLNGPSDWSFNVAIAGEGPMPETKSGTVTKSNPTYTFGPITYDKPGTYTYTVSESGSQAGIENDTEASKTVTVVVTDNKDGTLSAKVQGADEGSSSTTFTNKYDVKPTTAEIPFTKEVKIPEGFDGPNEWSYTFNMTALDGAPEPESTSGTATNENPTYTFGPITYDKPGTYEYSVSETGQVNGVTNDPLAGGIKVIVTVTDQGDGTLKAEVKGENDVELKFINPYDCPPIEIKADFELTKKLNNWKSGDKFKFKLTAKNGTPMPDKVLAIATKNNKKITFGKITYTKPGVYKYTVKEVKGSKKNIKYDTGKRVITVTVKDNHDGTMSATYKVTGGKVFKNEYKKIPPKKTPPTPKTGDTQPIGLWAGILAAALAALIGLVIYRRRRA